MTYAMSAMIVTLFYFSVCAMIVKRLRMKQSNINIIPLKENFK